MFKEEGIACAKVSRWFDEGRLEMRPAVRLAREREVRRPKAEAGNDVSIFSSEDPLSLRV